MAWLGTATVSVKMNTLQIYGYIIIHIHAKLCLRVYVRVCMYVCMYAFVYTYVRTNVCVDVRITL